MTEILSTTRNPEAPWLECPDTIDRIAHDLVEHTLRFWGNFLDYSGVFDIITSDKEIIAKLSELIARNKATPKYIAARRDLEASRAEERARRIEEWKNRIKLSEAINGR